jgi:hypothetical protein
MLSSINALYYWCSKKKLRLPVVANLAITNQFAPTYNHAYSRNHAYKCLNGDFTQVLRNRCADGSLGKRCGFIWQNICAKNNWVTMSKWMPLLHCNLCRNPSRTDAPAARIKQLIMESI